ncbi:putative salivary gland protein 12 [Frankliniella occidentalis]|nr:putative salivary gland protein 12 [Frankliniella occidentalis]
MHLRTPPSQNGPVKTRAMGPGACHLHPRAGYLLLGGKLHLRLNMTTRPIAHKYREGKVKRTLKTEFKKVAHPERTRWDPKDGELCLARTKSGETLMEVRSDSDVQIDRRSWEMNMPNIMDEVCEEVGVPSITEVTTDGGDEAMTVSQEIDHILDSIDVSTLPQREYDNIISDLFKASSPPPLNQVHLSFGSVSTCEVSAEAKQTSAKVSMATGQNIDLSLGEVMAQCSRKRTAPTVLTGTGKSGLKRIARKQAKAVQPDVQEKLFEVRKRVKENITDTLTTPRAKLKEEARKKEERLRKEQSREHRRLSVSEEAHKKRQGAMDRQRERSASKGPTTPKPQSKKTQEVVQSAEAQTPHSGGASREEEWTPQDKGGSSGAVTPRKTPTPRKPRKVAVYGGGGRGPYSEHDILGPLLEYMPEDKAREYVSGLKRNIGFATTTDERKSMRWLPKDFCKLVRFSSSLPFDPVNDKQLEAASIAATVTAEADEEAPKDNKEDDADDAFDTDMVY